MSKRCMECDEAPAEHDDPRHPVLDTEPCLCQDCFVAAIEDEIANHEDEIRDLERAAERVGVTLN